MSIDRLINKIIETSNPSCVGLDTKLEYIPDYIKDNAWNRLGHTPEAAAEVYFEYNKGIIDEIYDIVPAIKPQLAFYEVLGHHGIHALEKTVAYAKAKGLYVINDAKRGDIGSTMEAYAAAHLGAVDIGGTKYAPMDADALTVNGYLGSDTLKPLTDVCSAGGKAVFVLVKTSNPSSVELQDLLVRENKVYEIMGDLCEKWGEPIRGKYGYSAVGAVVGATFHKQLASLRRRLPHTFFLVPGYGAQGGSAQDAAAAFDSKGVGAVVNSSRAILTAWQRMSCDGRDYAKAARQEALNMKKSLTEHIVITK